MPFFSAKHIFFIKLTYSPFKEESELEATKYIAGYIHHKFNKKFPSTAFPFSSTLAKSKWIEIKNRGSLTFPSELFVEKLIHWGNMFNEFHGETIFRGENPVEKFVNLIVTKEKFTEPHNVFIVKLFTNLRFFRRIRILNNIIHVKEKAEKARKLKQIGQFCM